MTERIGSQATPQSAQQPCEGRAREELGRDRASRQKQKCIDLQALGGSSPRPCHVTLVGMPLLAWDPGPARS